MSGMKSKSPIAGEFSFERFSGAEVSVSYVYSPGSSEDGEHIEWLTDFNPPLSDDEADHLWACISDRAALKAVRKSAAILLSHAEHGVEGPMPQWLIDCRRDIEEFSASEEVK